jgi:hypothetical protein
MAKEPKPQWWGFGSGGDKGFGTGGDEQFVVLQKYVLTFNVAVFIVDYTMHAYCLPYLFRWN